MRTFWRDVLAGLAVAARARLDETPALVDDLDARAVELRLDAEARRLAVGQAVDHAPVELGELLGGVRVVEREHPHRVLDLHHLRARLAADALGRRVGRDELGVRLLERAQLAQQRVELGVAHDRVVEDVVAVVVRVESRARGPAWRIASWRPRDRQSSPTFGRGARFQWVDSPSRPCR